MRNIPLPFHAASPSREHQLTVFTCGATVHSISLLPSLAVLPAKASVYFGGKHGPVSGETLISSSAHQLISSWTTCGITF